MLMLAIWFGEVEQYCVQPRFDKICQARRKTNGFRIMLHS